jgi:hypothetical protein
MRLVATVFLLVFFLPFHTQPPPVRSIDAAQAEPGEVLSLLNGQEFKTNRQLLVSKGKGAFDAFDRLLKSKTLNNVQTARVFIVLKEVDADRSMFIEHAVSNFSNSDSMVRMRAVELLSVIGTSKDTAGLHVLLSDKVTTVGYNAANAMKQIGEKIDLLAFDIWLNATNHKFESLEKQNDHNELVRHVKKCKDDLVKKLASKD